MNEEKLIQEQEVSDGHSLDDTVESEIASISDENEIGRTLTSELLDGNISTGESGDEPISDKSSNKIREPVGMQISVQDDEVTGVDAMHDSLRANNDLIAEVEQVSTAVSRVLSDTKRISSEIHELHRLYHNEFAGRLKSMQDELDGYHDADRGNTFDGILSAIARIYVNNESLVDEISDSKARKNVKYMLLDMSELLEEYGVLRLKSKPGDKRNVRHCQIVERIPTDNPDIHDTVAASHSAGFYKGNRTVIKELVDVYFFDKRELTNSDTNKEVTANADISAEVE